MTATLSSDSAPNGVEEAILAGKGCGGHRSNGQVEVKVGGKNGVVEVCGGGWWRASDVGGVFEN